MFEKLIPGTDVVMSGDCDGFESFKQTIKMTNGLTLSQVCAIVDEEPTNIQNWVKRGYVARPVNKKYYEKHLSRILLIESLKFSMKMDDVANLLYLINGEVEDESDDMVSEIDLYNSLTNLVKNVDDYNELEEAISKELKNYRKEIKEDMRLILRIMYYAYQSGLCQKEARKNYQVLKRKRK